MASMTFGDPATKAGDNTVVEGEIVEQAAPEKTVAVVQSAPPAIYVADEDAEGEFSERDIIWPYLKLVTKTSSDAETFGIGSWVVNGEVAIGSKDKPLRVTALKIQTAYQERVPYGAGVRPRLFRTATDALKAGFNVEWGAPDPRADEVLGIRFWVPQPEGVDAPHIFTLSSPEGMGTVVKFFAARTTFSSVGKTLKSAKMTFLSTAKGGLASGVWELYVTKEAKNGNTWLQPRLRPAGRTEEKMAAFLKDLAV